MLNIQSNVIKGITLVNKIIEFAYLTPNKNHWSFEYQKDTPTRYFRLKQIDALIQAFGLRMNPNILSIGEEMENILNGSFYEFLGMKISKELNTYVHEYLMNTYLDKDSIRDIDLWDFKLGCRELIKYKILLSQLLKFNSGVSECSPRYNFTYFQIHLVREISENIIGNFDKLDEILELIINPQHKVFSEQELVQNFGYVSESDLIDADLEDW